MPSTTKIILSNHDFQETPTAPYLQARAAAMWGYAACIDTPHHHLRQRHCRCAEFQHLPLTPAVHTQHNIGAGEVPITTKIILSNHNFQETPSAAELQARAAAMWDSGADIVKIATMANDITDSAAVLSLLQNKAGKCRRSAAVRDYQVMETWKSNFARKGLVLLHDTCPIYGQQRSIM